MGCSGKITVQTAYISMTLPSLVVSQRCILLPRRQDSNQQGCITDFALWRAEHTQLLANISQHRRWGRLWLLATCPRT